MKLFIKFCFMIFLSWAQLVCAQEGTLKWKYDTGNQIYRDPSIDLSGNIGITNLSGKFYVLNSTGSLVWSLDTGYIHISQLVDSNGIIYLNQLQSIEAYYPNGIPKWSKTVYCCPYVLAIVFALGNDGTIYVGGNDTTLRAFDSEGNEKWKINLMEIINKLAVNRRYGTVYAASYGEFSCSLSAINPNGTIGWQIMTTGAFFGHISLDINGLIYLGYNPSFSVYSTSYLYCLYPNGSLKWKYQTGGPVNSQPAIGNDGTIYFGSEDYYLYALNPDGSLKWKYPTGYFIDGASAIGNDGVIYFGSYDEYFYALNPNGTLRWRYKTNSAIASSPAIGSDGTLYFGSTDKYFYALHCSSTGLTNSPWPRGGHDNQNTNLGGEPTSAPLFPELYP